MSATRWAGLLLVTVASFALAACDGGDASPTASATSVVDGATPLLPTLPPGTAQPSVTPEPGLPASLELTAEPQMLVCDGVRASKITARVLDVTGTPVADGTEVHFSVVTLGTADPIDATTVDGVAETSVVALGSQVGVVVNVTAGAVQKGIRVDCQ